MKLLVRRNQRMGGMLGGKTIFTLEVRADLTADEKEAIKKYKLGETVLYKRFPDDNEPLPGVSGFVASTLRAMSDVTIFVRDLEGGRTIECKDAIELLGTERVIKEAASTFKDILDATRSFGGEEVFEL